MTAMGPQANLSSCFSSTSKVLLDGVDTTRFTHQHMLCGTVANELMGTKHERSLMSVWYVDCSELSRPVR